MILLFHGLDLPPTETIALRRRRCRVVSCRRDGTGRLDRQGTSVKILSPIFRGPPGEGRAPFSRREVDSDLKVRTLLYWGTELIG